MMAMLSRIWERLTGAQLGLVRRAAAKALSSDGRPASWWRVELAEYAGREPGPERLFDAWIGTGRGAERTVVVLFDDGRIEVGSANVMAWLMTRWHQLGAAPSPSGQADVFGFAQMIEPSQVIADRDRLDLLNPDDAAVIELPQVFTVGDRPALRYWTTYPDLSRTTAVLTEPGRVDLTTESPGELS